MYHLVLLWKSQHESQNIYIGGNYNAIFSDIVLSPSPDVLKLNKLVFCVISLNSDNKILI